MKNQSVYTSTYIFSRVAPSQYLSNSTLPFRSTFPSRFASFASSSPRRSSRYVSVVDMPGALYVLAATFRGAEFAATRLRHEANAEAHKERVSNIATSATRLCQKNCTTLLFRNVSRAVRTLNISSRCGITQTLYHQMLRQQRASGEAPHPQNPNRCARCTMQGPGITVACVPQKCCAVPNAERETWCLSRVANPQPCVLKPKKQSRGPSRRCDKAPVLNYSPRCTSPRPGGAGCLLS
jgi:hypothetical protein